MAALLHYWATNLKQALIKAYLFHIFTYTYRSRCDSQGDADAVFVCAALDWLWSKSSKPAELRVLFPASQISQHRLTDTHTQTHTHSLHIGPHKDFITVITEQKKTEVI